MACARPMISAPIPGQRTALNKQKFIFLGSALSWSKALPKDYKVLPCRQCVQCRLRKSSEWATRLMQEKKHHENAMFLTLTYSDEKVPRYGSLNRSHLQTFWKDLRRRIDYHYGSEKIKFYYVGEYGSKTQRPHYHAILYGGPVELYARRYEKDVARSGGPQFISPDLDAVWEYGLHRYSEVTFESAAYVARYALKKVAGTVEGPGLVREFSGVSRGLGREWIESNGRDVWNLDSVFIAGRGHLPVPEYYLRCLERSDPLLFKEVKEKRAQEAQVSSSLGEFHSDLARRFREGDVKQRLVDYSLKRGGL